MVNLSSIPAMALLSSSKVMKLTKSLSLEATLQICDCLCILFELHSLVHWLIVVVVLVHGVLRIKISPGAWCELTDPGRLIMGNIGLVIILHLPHVGDIRRMWRQHGGKLG